MFSSRDRERIEAAINAKIPAGLKCPLCQHPVWTMIDGPAVVTVRERFNVSDFDSGLPSVALVCSNCGNTVLLNLFKLGLGDIVKERFGPTIEPPPLMFRGGK